MDGTVTNDECEKRNHDPEQLKKLTDKNAEKKIE